MHKKLFQNGLTLLQSLIAIPSFSKEESETANIIEDFFKKHSVQTNRIGNNVWARNKHYDAAKPTILLNSHHDTVRPNAGYTRAPFSAEIKDSKLYGLEATTQVDHSLHLLLPFCIIMIAKTCYTTW